MSELLDDGVFQANVNSSERETSVAKTLRQALRPFTKRSNAKAFALFVMGYTVFIVFLGLTLYLNNFWARLFCSLATGSAIASLFVIGHDAGHGSFTSSKKMDIIIGRLSLLPALHNFTLWRIVHNRLHHAIPCIKGPNSWSPMTKAEYDQLGWWRKGLEILYRSPFGFGPYYFTHRWLKEKFYPPAHLSDTQRSSQWQDFFLILLYMAILAGVFWYAAQANDQLSYGQAWLWGFLIPFAVWNYLVAFTVYVQHTHPKVMWFLDSDAVDQYSDGQHDISVHMIFPKWYTVLTNNIMEHPAHHVNTKIPLYNLSAAQAHLNELIGSAAIIDHFTPMLFFKITSHCQLYDYEQRCWLKFDGTPSQWNAA